VTAVTVADWPMMLCAVVGIIVTSKKRQDLRVQLQKRARRRAEKKVEYLEDDKNWKEVSNVTELCRSSSRRVK